MANTLIQVRVDDELKKEASDIYERLGIDLSTAVRIFLKRSVQENGIPFSMKLPNTKNKLASIVDEMNSISKKSGNSRMTLEEINSEIEEVRKRGYGVFG